MSSNVVWNIVRKRSAYRVRRNGVEFNSHPRNLMNKNTYKYSALAQAKTVGIESEDGRATLTVSRPHKAKNPSQALWKVGMNASHKTARRANNIRRNMSRAYFRRDLEKAALARMTRLHIAASRPAADKKPRALRTSEASN